jgi:flotillin
LRTALASEKQSAKALEESYVAEQKQRTLVPKENVSQNANVVIPAQIAKQKQLLMHKQKQEN